jgi:hypothetical protein
MLEHYGNSEWQALPLVPNLLIHFHFRLHF